MDRCSVTAAAEPLLGTAPVAQTWVLLEDNGPWGNKAPGTARFAAAPELAAAANKTHTKVLLVREPSVRVAKQRRVWVAHVASGRLWSGVVEEPDELLGWDLHALADGATPPGLTTSSTFLWLVCTNSSRDACCALVGRPLVDDLAGLAAANAVTLLESSHLGGHRFAPTALALPSGYAFGRLTVASATAAFTSLQDGNLVTANLRGRTSLPRWAQVADTAARKELGWSKLTPLTLDPDPSSTADTPDVVTVTTPDGRAVIVRLGEQPIDPRPESCGKAPVPGSAIVAARVEHVGSAT